MKRVVALAGRPNTGKTTLFNALTGRRQRVANFAGCTVEKAVGGLSLGDAELEIVDLPGTHSLLPDTEDERVAFRFLAECAEPGRDLLVVCVAEASNLENDLALAAAFKAAGYPTALAVNMIDEARLNGLQVDADALSAELGLPAALLSARSGEGLQSVLELLRPRVLAPDLSEAVDFRSAPPARLRELQADGVAAARRASAAAVRRPSRALLKTVSRSVAIDRVLFHPVAGPAFLAAVLWLVFQALFAGAEPLMDGLAGALDAAAGALRASLPEGALSSLLCDGVIPGVSAVVVFVPQIAILFTLIGLLEQSGYLPRAGAMVDRALRPFGLDGKVFLPFLSGFACAIPGVMAARTIASERRRLVAILLTPLMTCSARLPVYTLIITAFVRPESRAAAMAGLYVFGVALALVLAFAFKWTRLHDGNPAPATVLPPYRVPHGAELARYVWARCRHFLSRAGKVIFGVSLLLWALSSFPGGAGLEGSALGRLGKLIEPVFQPLGWDWRISVAVLASLAAREVFVGTLAAIWALGGSADGLPAVMAANYGPGVAASLLVFFAIALQCVSTIATVRRETGGWKWPALQFGGFFVLAYALAFAASRLFS